MSTGAETEPRWQRLEPDERRREILNCAIRLFGERPYAAVSTTELAREAGVARGLLNHYFGTKRDLYLEVVRTMVITPGVEEVGLPTGTLPERIDACVTWFLDVMSRHGRAWLAAVGAEGVGRDPEVEAILEEADDLAADRVIEALGMGDLGDDRAILHAMVRAYGGLVKAAGRELVDRRSLDRAQVHLLLSAALAAVVRDAFPGACGR